MASTEEYLLYVLDLLSLSDGIAFRPMMGEYVLYAEGRVIGGVYDDRFLLKDLPAVRALLKDAIAEPPYPGAKPMLLIDTEDRTLLREVVTAAVDALPPPKPKKSKA